MSKLTGISEITIWQPWRVFGEIGSRVGNENDERAREHGNKNREVGEEPVGKRRNKMGKMDIEARGAEDIFQVFGQDR